MKNGTDEAAIQQSLLDAKNKRSKQCIEELSLALNDILARHQCRISYYVQLPDGTWANLTNFYATCRLQVDAE